MPTQAVTRRPAASAALLMAAHPLPALAVTVMATAFAASVGHGPAGCVLVALAVLSGQLCVGWSNDLIDRRRDLRAGRPDKPLATGALTPQAAAAAACGAGLACVPLSLASGPAAAAAHLLAVAAALAYNVGLKRMLWSWFPYALAFALLPAFVTLGLPGRPWPPAWLLVTGALLGVGAHLTNVLPDLDADLACGIRGLPHRLGRTPSRALAALLLLAASATLVLGAPGAPGPAGWTGLALAAGLATAAALPRVRHPDSRLPFQLTIALSLLDVALLLLRGTTLR